MATDLTNCQNSILREEKSLLQRKIPPAAASAPPARLKVTTHAADDAPPYPQRTKRTVSSRTGATKDQASPLLFDMEEFTTLHRQTTGDGAHRRLNLQGAQQRPLQQAFLHGGCCVDKRPVAKQRCGSEDSIYCNTRTTVAKTPGDGPGTTAQADPTTTENHHPTHVRVLSSPAEEILVMNVHSF